MFLFASAELGFGSWIPTYAIKAKISTPEASSIYSLIFWASNCAFRLIWAYIPTTITKKLFYSLLGLFFSSLTLIFMQQFHLYVAICTVGSFFIGLFTSSIYTFCIALPADNGFSPSSKNTAHFVMANSFGQGFIIAPIGYSMDFFGFKSLIVIVFTLAVVANWSFCQVMSCIDQEKEALAQGDEEI